MHNNKPQTASKSSKKGKKKKNVRKYVLARDNKNNWNFLQEITSKEVLTRKTLYNDCLAEVRFGSGISKYNLILVFQEYVTRADVVSASTHVAVINGTAIKQVFDPEEQFSYTRQSSFDKLIYATGTILKIDQKQV